MNGPLLLHRHHGSVVAICSLPRGLRVGTLAIRANTKLELVFGNLSFVPWAGLRDMVEKQSPSPSPGPGISGGRRPSRSDRRTRNCPIEGFDEFVDVHVSGDVGWVDRAGQVEQVRPIVAARHLDACLDKAGFL